MTIAPKHTLDVARLGEVFKYLIVGDGAAKLKQSAWELAFIDAMHRQWKQKGVSSLTEDSLAKIEKIYVRC